MKYLPLSALALALSAVPVARAIDAVETIVVTASRVNERIENVTRDVTVVTQEMIERSGAQNVAELLVQAAGVQFVSNGNAGGTTSVFLRGANSNHTLVLVDGQRVSSSTTGLTAIESMTVSSIERIEIVRGPHSAFYGADALGGVVQIFTKASPATSIAVSGGSNKTLTAAAQAGGKSGGWRFGLGASLERSAGFNAITNENNFSYNPDRDGYRRANAFANVQYTLSAQNILSARLFHNDLNTQYDGGADFDDRAKTKVSGLTLTGEFGPTRVQLGLSQDDATFISAFPSAFRTRTGEASVQHSWTLSPSLQATGIVEAREERIATSEAFTKDTRRTVSAVGRLAGRTDGLSWNLAGRIDDSNQFDTRFTASGGVKFAIDRNLSFIANVGSAFKAPTFNDLYYPGFSNPNLRPERSVGADVGVQSTYGATAFAAVVHHARVNDLIVFQCDANFNCAPENVNRARTNGVSLSARTLLTSNTAVRATLDFQKPENQLTGAQLPRRAQRFGSVSVSQRIGMVNAFATLTASGRRFDDVANKVRLSGYARLDLGADIDLSKQLRVELRAKNVADRDIVLASDFATAGRELFVGIRWSAQ
jgi:vitamin B12 transporter